MKCEALIDPETRIALEGDALVAASKNPDSPRCGYEIEDDYDFCPSCGAKVKRTLSSDPAVMDIDAERLQIGEPRETDSAPNSKVKIPIWRIIVAILGVAFGVWQTSRDDRRDAASHDSFLRENNEGVDAFNRGLGYYEKKDFKKAVEWYRKAAEMGDASAQLNLGFCYDNGEGVEQDKKEAVKWYRKAAEQGNAKAQFNLGNMYSDGSGVEKDEAEAVKWYRKAAEQEYTDAQLNLGFCYSNGEGVEQDKKEAVKWYLKTAEQGNASAQFNLGNMYRNGSGVERDKAEAVKWYRKSAEQGDASAQFNLGVCYSNGEGVEEDKAEAAKWFRKAAAQGSDDAKEALKRLGVDSE